MFLCQLELPPAMIKHSWWQTERCTDPLLIYKGMYRLTFHLFASKMKLLGGKFQDCCLLEMWKCSGCSCSPKLPWKLAAFGLIWRARRKKPSDSWEQKKSMYENLHVLQACILNILVNSQLYTHLYTHRFIDRISHLSLNDECLLIISWWILTEWFWR